MTKPNPFKDHMDELRRQGAEGGGDDGGGDGQFNFQRSRGAAADLCECHGRGGPFSSKPKEPPLGTLQCICSTSSGETAVNGSG